jgi:pSer/pThr/pTyr-binding forkhead associated (FHA) protein
VDTLPQIPSDHPLRRTFVEQPADDDLPAVRAASQAAAPPLVPPPSPNRPPSPPVSTAPADDGEVPLARPACRPPVAVLWIFDDNGKTAELTRIRAGSFVIGRSDADLVIPHDSQISNRHAEIVRSCQDGEYQWRLRDLNSTNGTFVRARSALLKNGTEILLARNHLRFVAAAPAGPCEDGPPVVPDIRQTCRWNVAALTSSSKDRPCLVEVLPAGDGRRFPLSSDSVLAGSGSECEIALRDPLVNLRHARFHRDEQDRWHVDDLGSVNGVWVRITEVALHGQTAFLLGEQVFAVAFP